jgi:EAL domain-containing protein (putative c-di-GMP-specific phosphodiesterase class I)
VNGPVLLDQILAPGGLRPLFQPIYRLTPNGRKLEGLEALMRGPRETNAESAAVMFEYVRRKKQEIVVDRACVLTGLAAARGFHGKPRISLNAHAGTLARDPRFPGFVTDAAMRCGVSPDRLTIEIVEHGPALDVPSFSAAIDELRQRGVRIALDDVGVGTSNLRMMIDTRPDYFKIDRHFVTNAHRDTGKRATLEAVAHIAKATGASVVAEGVESQEELATVRQIGIELIQGYVFCTALGVEDLLEREPALRPNHEEK